MTMASLHQLKQCSSDSTSNILEQNSSDGKENLSKLIENKRIRTDEEINLKNGCCMYIQEEMRKRKIANVAVNKNDDSTPTSVNETLLCATQLCKSIADHISEKKLDTTVHLKNSPLSELTDTLFNVEDLYMQLDCDNSIESRCDSVLNLASCYLSEDTEVKLSECLTCINLLSDSYNYACLAVCHALLLCAFTKTPLTLDEIRAIEDYIIRLADSRVDTEGELCIRKPIGTYNVSVLPVKHHHAVHELCNKLFSEDKLDVKSLDLSTICCSALCNLSLCVKQLSFEVAEKFVYGTNTLQYVLGMTGKSTQGIVYENMMTYDDRGIFISSSSHTVKQCLEVLEHALSLNPDAHCHSLEHEQFSLPHCLTRLLAWCISALFPQNQTKKRNLQDSSFDFHLSTLLSILKILSVLTFNPNQYDTFTNIKGLMEKIMICALQAYFELEENHFAVLILCLEMLINLYIKNQRTFVLLCLKKFKICASKEILAIEALVEVLSNSLNKIKEVKVIKSSLEKTEINNVENKETDEENKQPDMQLVLQTAGKDMELSTIVSFVCVLLVFFMKTKQSFREFIQTKLSLDMFEEAITICKKFLEFASLTGGMPQTGILILELTIKKLHEMNNFY